MKYKISGDVIRSIYSVGFPSIIMASVGSVMTFGMNKILMGFTSTATAVFGVYFKLQSFIFMPVFGLNNGMVPIVAYNYGARKPKRITKAIKLSIIYGVCIMLAGFAVFQLFPGSLLGIFSASDDMMAIGIPALFKPCSVCAAPAGSTAPGCVYPVKSRWPWSLLVVLSHCRGVLGSDLLCVYTICV